MTVSSIRAASLPWWLLHPYRVWERLRSNRAVPLVSHVFVSCTTASRIAESMRREWSRALEPVEEHCAIGVSRTAGAAQDLEVAEKPWGLRKIEARLEIGHEQRRRGQAVQYSKPGRFGDREQELGSGIEVVIFRRDEYTNRWI